MTKWIATLAIGAALAAGTPGTAEAQGPIVTGGLVNITVTDLNSGNILSNNNVALGVALNLAANVCGVGVNVLATQLGTGGPVTCQSATEAVTISPRQR